MPSLVGMVSTAAPAQRRRTLTTMLGALSYQPHHRSDTYSCERLGVELAWTFDVAQDDPLHGCNEDAGSVVILSGEIDGADHASAFAQHGLSFIENLNGWFAGVVIDLRQGKTYLFNDRYGMKRLFIHERPDGIYFSCEAKALLAAFPETRSFDPDGLAEYFTAGCTLGACSLFKGISVLPGASLLTLSNGQIQSKLSYFDRAIWENQSQLEPRQLEEEAQHLIPKIVRKHGTVRRPVGLSLTGGLDSRIVAACLQMSPGQYPCYTFGSKYRDTFDVTVARAIAHACGQTHATLVLGDEFLKDFPVYLAQAVACSDGYIGMSGAAEFYLNGCSRTISPIRLTGNYGSELLRGTRTFKADLPHMQFVATDFRQAVHRARKRFVETSPTHPVSFTLFHQAPNQGYGRLSVERAQVLVRTPFMDNELARLVYRAPRGYRAGAEISAQLIARNRPDLLEITTDQGELGGGTKLRQYARKAHRAILFKGEYWASHGMPDAAAVISQQFPILSPERYLLGRHKFQHFRRWICNELSNDVKNILFDPAVDFQGYLDPRALHSMVDAHLTGRRNYLAEIDMALTVALSVRTLFSAIQQPSSGVFERLWSSRPGSTSVNAMVH
jgi:asparagine synthase (glutamine-hydrolysing)